MNKRVLITGITGQDGSYLAELLLDKEYEVYGLVRRSSSDNQLQRIQHLLPRIHLLSGDLLDQTSLESAVKFSRPNEVYNLAAQSFVGTSWVQPAVTSDITGLGVTRLLEAIRLYALDARVYQASTSEMFGATSEIPQTESTPFRPRSPYAVAKTYAHWIAKSYQDSYDLFICCGILFNHESPRRGSEFVTRKITDRVARIKLGLANELSLGNLRARRDWGFAGDYVEAMWKMLQQDKPDDFVIATGQSRSVQDFTRQAFRSAGIDWQEAIAYITVDPALYRPAEVHELCGDASKAKQELGWEPRVSFEQLVQMMVDADLRRLTSAR